MMDSFEFNKIAGGILGTLMLTMMLGIFAHMIFAPNTPAKPGYDLPSAAAEQTATATPGAPVEPLPVLLAKADPAKGQGFAKACGACHNFEKGGAAKVGPPLWGVVGRQVASIAGFGYSDAMKAKGGAWSMDDINKFIANPKAYVAGTKMGYAGEQSPEKRAAIIAYLDKLSDNPEPLPKP